MSSARNISRYAHVCTSHGVAMPAMRKAAAAQHFAGLAEAQFAKGRQRPRTTKVSRYVERRAPAVSRGIAKVLKVHAKRVAGIVRAKAGALLKDATSDRERILRIIEELDLEDLGLDIDGELTTAMLAAFKRAAELGLTEVGLSIDAEITEQLDEAAAAFALDRGGELIKDLAGTTEEAMEALIERGVREGMSVDMLADEVEKLGAFGAARAEMIARTELAFAHVRGNVEGWRQSGEVVGKRSILGDLHDEEDECDEAAEAGVVGLDEEFAPGLMFPPYHPRCVCDISVALRGEESDGGASADDEDEEP